MTDTEAHLYREIGERITLLRKTRRPRISQEKLAESVDLTRTSVTNIEAGRQAVPLITLYQIACELEVPIEDLLPSIETLLTILKENA